MLQEPPSIAATPCQASVYTVCQWLKMGQVFNNQFWGMMFLTISRRGINVYKIQVAV